MDKWKKTEVYKYIGILFSLHKEGNSAICNKMDEAEDIILSEINQSQNENYCMISRYLKLLICRI
jgi:hypothetical protein